MTKILEDETSDNCITSNYSQTQTGGHKFHPLILKASNSFQICTPFFKFNERDCVPIIGMIGAL
jgi:hypothetical protein